MNHAYIHIPELGLLPDGVALHYAFPSDAPPCSASA